MTSFHSGIFFFRYTKSLQITRKKKWLTITKHAKEKVQVDCEGRSWDRLSRLVCRAPRKGLAQLFLGYQQLYKHIPEEIQQM